MMMINLLDRPVEPSPELTPRLARWAAERAIRGAPSTVVVLSAKDGPFRLLARILVKSGDLLTAAGCALPRPMARKIGPWRELAD
jgi:hypothetical protein